MKKTITLFLACLFVFTSIGIGFAGDSAPYKYKTVYISCCGYHPNTVDSLYDQYYTDWWYIGRTGYSIKLSDFSDGGYADGMSLLDYYKFGGEIDVTIFPCPYADSDQCTKTAEFNWQYQSAEARFTGLDENEKYHFLVDKAHMTDSRLGNGTIIVDFLCE
ncbi:MAG: hypothetical protein GY874_10945 [Desulfobacteraceae bacterium]|nr:hypothetical protein [Desulfobacteraceae bacterium]